MGAIKIEKPTLEKLKELLIPERPENTDQWSVWECEPSSFDWSYSDTEIAYVYEGKVVVKAGEESVEIVAGDLVEFPKGLACHWHVLEKIRKVYQFR